MGDVEQALSTVGATPRIAVETAHRELLPQSGPLVVGGVVPVGRTEPGSQDPFLHRDPAQGRNQRNALPLCNHQAHSVVERQPKPTNVGSARRGNPGAARSGRGPGR